MPLKILCLHGVGRHPEGGQWETDWREAIRQPMALLAPDLEVQVEFVHLDPVFDAHEIGFFDAAKALLKLAASGLAAPFRRSRSISDRIRWTAGMTVQWVENEALRDQTRQLLHDKLLEHRPQVVIGHSLGSLVAYDTFTHPQLRPLANDLSFVSCGSQIGNPFVVGNFAHGRLTPLRQARRWLHLYNEHDDVFTAPIRLGGADNFVQVDTPFDETGLGDHAALGYLKHSATEGTLWTELARDSRGQRTLLMPLTEAGAQRRKRQPRGQATAAADAAVAAQALGTARLPARKPRRRALLVGINEYADPAARLTGCINDVYLVSALLQESGFEADDIRIVLDGRATADGVRERLDWLLDDARDGDTCFFHFSGHGAQLPVYAPDGHVDRVQETLVTHDFDWSAGRAFSDQDFQALYSQLPYGLRLICLFDCCHSGGMTRAPAGRVRGITPPDDIRHRMLRWDAAREMWLPRRLPAPSAVARDYDTRFNGPVTRDQLRSSHRLGQAMALRSSGGADRKAFKKAAAIRGHEGPYLPTLIYACTEQQLAHEYEHGPTAFGAFTYCFVKTLRAQRRQQAEPRFAALVKAVGRELADLGYAQSPLLVAPSAVQGLAIPLSA